MLALIKYTSIALVVLILSCVAYAVVGYFDAISDAEVLRQRADDLIAGKYSGESLGEERLHQLLLVQDPAFFEHSGVDFTTPGAGLTTISQSVSKRLAFTTFKPGIGKIRQTGYALGLESVLGKDQILALWLDTLEMGEGPHGWMTGFHKSSDEIYGKAPNHLSDEEFYKLLAVLIAPGKFNLMGDDPALSERVRRVSRLVAHACVPESNGDVWLEGCR